MGRGFSCICCIAALYLLLLHLLLLLLLLLHLLLLLYCCSCLPKIPVCMSSVQIVLPLLLLLPCLLGSTAAFPDSF